MDAHPDAVAGSEEDRIGVLYQSQWHLPVEGGELAAERTGQCIVEGLCGGRAVRDAEVDALGQPVVGQARAVPPIRSRRGPRRRRPDKVRADKAYEAAKTMSYVVIRESFL
ncbi:hypothetical protein GCM10009550_76560 [Actinocorallia libanotica]|uniref:Uncharacterized protein n=1 Tax=Actinocorallia libanotica TaxID=46162 RepID=A0ABN1S0Y4_9ACTN